MSKQTLKKAERLLPFLPPGTKAAEYDGGIMLSNTLTMLTYHERRFIEDKYITDFDKATMVLKGWVEELEYQASAMKKLMSKGSTDA